MFKNLYDPSTRFMSDFVPQILRRAAIVHQWDDHDSGLNNVDKNYADWELTQQAFTEYTPTYPLPEVTPGTWQKFRYAQAEFFVLDCRSQRDPGSDPDGPNKSMLDGNNLGTPGELYWLENGLLTSTALWKIIFTSVITNPSTKQNDAWGAYQTEWNALKAFINSNNIQGVVFIAGDLHLGAIDDGTQAGFPEMCVAAANDSRSGFCRTAAYGTWSEGHYDGDCAGYGLVSITQNPDQLTLEALDQFGQTHIAYTVSAVTPTPTATPTPSPEAPRIIKQPSTRSVNIGAKGFFSVAATGTAPLSYQWRKNGSDISGGNGSDYTTPPATAEDNGSLFSVFISNIAGSVLSEAKRLTVNLPPTITTQPQDKTVFAGQTAKFTVVAGGSQPLAYQWTKNGANLGGATKASYTTPPATPDDNGALFAVTVSNSHGSVRSASARLTVQ